MDRREEILEKYKMSFEEAKHIDMSRLTIGDIRLMINNRLEQAFAALDDDEKAEPKGECKCSLYAKGSSLAGEKLEVNTKDCPIHGKPAPKAEVESSVTIAIPADLDGNLVHPIEIEGEKISKLGIWKIKRVAYWIVRSDLIQEPKAEEVQLDELKIDKEWVKDNPTHNIIRAMEKINELCAEIRYLKSREKEGK